MRTPYMKETEEALLHTYNRFPVEFDRGEGVYLYDAEGRKYLHDLDGISNDPIPVVKTKWDRKK